jgi:hypothetical protein
MDSIWNKKWNSIVIKYKIVEVNTNQHSIVVRFYTDIITEAMLATDVLDNVIRRCRTDFSFDLPVPCPQGDALNAFIAARAPVAWFETQEAVLNPAVDTSLAAVLPLVGVENTVQVQPTVQ